MVLDYSGASAREARQRSTMGKKNWYPIKPRKFGYDVSVRRANVRPYVRPDSGGGGGASRDLPHRHPYGKLRNAIFAWRFFVDKSEKHSFLFAMSTNDRRG